MFGLVDVFVFGLGCDIAGAWLLSRGLLASPEQLAQRAATYYSLSPPLAVGLISDRVSASLGLIVLILGFGLQAMGYGIMVETDDPSTGNWLGVIVAVLVPIVIAYLVDKATHERRMRSLMVEVAHWDNGGERKALPNALVLVEFGRVWTVRNPNEGGEAPEHYAQQVFSVEAEARPL